MITAQEARETTQKKWESIEILDLLLHIDSAIKQAVEQGVMAVIVNDLPVPVAEKAAWEMEEFGFECTVANGKLFQGRSWADLHINWKYRPRSYAYLGAVESGMPEVKEKK